MKAQRYPGQMTFGQLWTLCLIHQTGVYFPYYPLPPILGSLLQTKRLKAHVFPLPYHKSPVSSLLWKDVLFWALRWLNIDLVKNGEHLCLSPTVHRSSGSPHNFYYISWKSIELKMPRMVYWISSKELIIKRKIAWSHNQANRYLVI